MSQNNPNLRLPVEIILDIFHCLGRPSEATALASTCKYFNSIWTTHEAEILLHIARKHIPAFEDAVLAIRATDISEAYMNQSRNKPKLEQASNPIPKPTIEPNRLRSTALRPTLDEIRKVYDLHLLVSCILKFGGGLKEHDRNTDGTLLNLRKGFEFPRTDMSNRDYAILPDLEATANDDEREFAIQNYRIYASMYRVFLAGAMLAPAYLEPFLSGDPQMERLLQHPQASPWQVNPEARRYTRMHDTRYPRDTEVEFLKQYTPYNIPDATENEIEAIHGPLYEYLHDEGQKNILLDKETLSSDRIDVEECDSAETKNRYVQSSIIHQFIMLLMAEEILRRLLANVESDEVAICYRTSLPKHLSRPFKLRENQFKGYKKLRLFVYGIYELEEIWFPGRVSEVTENTWLLAQGSVTSASTLESKA
ncbi:hypothetical protein ABW19_dt0201593 [Dactylella cylindrospora]|nr:hypothetical protein ABW19_dt0201593 [Dactylella cylindrospora]